jgi:crotonobetainyl-CoA:carnitine CoA-transferase CaiB-like acyl-CoA transferase
MHRAAEYEDDPQLQARDFFRAFEQPGLDPVVIENAPFTSLRIPAPENTPAPAVGQHTREICVDLLGMDADDVEHLLAQGALEAPVEANPDAGEPVPAT